MQVKGELDINRMPEREAKRILDRIVSAYGLVIDANYEEVRKKHMGY